MNEQLHATGRHCPSDEDLYTCEICGGPAGRGGVTCDHCTLERLDGLLDDPVWVRNAAGRVGDRKGESMVDTLRRESDGLRWLGEVRS